ncbi:MAG: hypothetical protein ACJA1A_002763 [Saprospiraceae bacterium]|jgi:hypothetical protein
MCIIVEMDNYMYLCATKIKRELFLGTKANKILFFIHSPNNILCNQQTQDSILIK